MPRLAIRGPIFHITDNPAKNPAAWSYLPKGVMIIQDGIIEQVMPDNELTLDMEKSFPVFDYENCLICPGFVDAHIHYAQTRIIASSAPGLLEWLEKHTFPEECKFSDPEYASLVAVEFFNELVRNGTTSALVYPTVHRESVDSFFEESVQRGMRMVAGKVLMNRNAPPELCDGEDLGYQSTSEQIRKWNGTSRQSYAVTPRFAGTSTHDQLKICGKLIAEFPDVLLHTHLSETKSEIDWTLGLFPEFKDYLGVYEGFGLVTDRSLFAHCIHLSSSECERLADAGATAILCPTSNLFLGSGIVRPIHLSSYGVPTALGTDIGGGTSFSMLETMQELYKAGCLNGELLSSLELFYLATLGGARALHIDQYIGNFEPGKEADFVVLDTWNNPLMKNRLEQLNSIEDELFAYAIMGRAQNVQETWSMGKRIYARDSLPMDYLVH